MVRKEKKQKQCNYQISPAFAVSAPFQRYDLAALDPLLHAVGVQVQRRHGQAGVPVQVERHLCRSGGRRAGLLRAGWGGASSWPACYLRTSLAAKEGSRREQRPCTPRTPQAAGWQALCCCRVVGSVRTGAQPRTDLGHVLGRGRDVEEEEAAQEQVVRGDGRVSCSGRGLGLGWRELLRPKPCVGHAGTAKRRIRRAAEPCLRTAPSCMVLAARSIPTKPLYVLPPPRPPPPSHTLTPTPTHTIVYTP